MGLSIEEQREIVRANKRSIEDRKKAKQEKNRRARESKMGSAKIRVDDLMVRGVYFLYQGKEIVYIGMSDKNIMERICAHTEDTEKGFDSFTFNSHGGTKKQIEHIEKLMIKKYNPKYNVRHKQKVKPPKIIYC